MFNVIWCLFWFLVSLCTLIFGYVEFHGSIGFAFYIPISLATLVWFSHLVDLYREGKSKWPLLK